MAKQLARDTEDLLGTAGGRLQPLLACEGLKVGLPDLDLDRAGLQRCFAQTPRRHLRKAQQLPLHISTIGKVDVISLLAADGLLDAGGRYGPTVDAGRALPRTARETAKDWRENAIGRATQIGHGRDIQGMQTA